MQWAAMARMDGVTFDEKDFVLVIDSTFTDRELIETNWPELQMILVSNIQAKIPNVQAWKGCILCSR